MAKLPLTVDVYDSSNNEEIKKNQKKKKGVPNEMGIQDSENNDKKQQPPVVGMVTYCVTVAVPPPCEDSSGSSAGAASAAVDACNHVVFLLGVTEVDDGKDKLLVVDEKLRTTGVVLTAAGANACTLGAATRQTTRA